MTTLLFYIVVLQFIIQLVLYESVKSVVLKATTALHKFIKRLCGHKNKASKVLNFFVGNINTAENTTKALAVQMFALNILISFSVAYFSGAGLIVGIANLTASCILGLVMSYDVYKTKRSLVEASVAL